MIKDIYQGIVMEMHFVLLPMIMFLLPDMCNAFGKHVIVGFCHD